MFLKLFKKSKSNLVEHYKGIAAIIASVMLIITNWNELVEFFENIFHDEPKPFIINHHLGINFGYGGSFYYPNMEGKLSKIGYLNFIKVTNNTDKIAQINSIELEMFLDNKWVNLPMIKSKINFNRNEIMKRDTLGMNYVYVDSLYIAREGDLSLSQTCYYYSFESQVRGDKINSGETITGWIPYIWPSEFTTQFAPKFSKVRYKLVTEKGIEYYEVLENIDIEKPVGNFENYYASALTLKGDTINISNFEIETFR